MYFQGALGIEAWLCWRRPLPTSHYIHPEFGFFCPTQRFRRMLRVPLACLVVAGVGAALMATADGPKLAAAVTDADEASTAERTQATSLAPFAAVAQRRQLCFRQAAQAAHGLGGERSPSNRCRCSRPQRSNDGQHRCGASRCLHRLPRRPGEARLGSDRGRELDGVAERCCYAQEQESASARGQKHRRDRYWPGLIPSGRF